MSQAQFDEYCDKIANTNDEEYFINNCKLEYVKMKCSVSSWTLLHRASYYGRLSLVRYLINQGADINAVECSGWTSLYWACYCNKESVVDILLENGADINIKNKNGSTCLDIAKQMNYPSIVKKIKDRQHLITNEDEVFKAAKDDELETFRLLFTSPFHLFVKHSKTGISIYETIKANNSERVIEFLQYKQISKYERETFYKLFIEKEPLFLKYLEDNPIGKFFFPCYIFDLEAIISISNINTRTSINFKTPLQLSIEFNSLFILGGINTHLKILEQEILFGNKKYLESLENIDIKLLEEIYQKKKYISNLRKNGFSEIHIAIFQNSVDLTKNILMNYPERIEDGADDVGTPIYHAIKRDNLNIVKCLMEYRPNLDYTDQIGLTLPQIAIINNNDQIINMLVERNVNWNKKSKLLISTENINYNDREVLDIILNNALITEEETAMSFELKIHQSIRASLFNQLNLENIENQDGNGNSLLHIATRLGLVVEIRKLVTNFPQCTNYRNIQGSTSLMTAVQISIDRMKGAVCENMLNVIQILNYNQEQYLNCVFDDGQGNQLSLLEKSFEADDEKLLLVILENEYFNEVLHESYIKTAVTKRYFNFLESYIKEENKVNFEGIITVDLYKSLYGIAPLKILKHFNKIFEFDKNLSSNLMNAAVDYDQNNLAKFQERIKELSDANEILITGETLISKILKSEDNTSKLYFNKILAEKNCRRNLINAKNIWGETALHVAVKMNKYDLIQSIVMLSQNVNEQNNNGETAIALIIKKLNESNEEEDRLNLFVYIQCLIDRKADIFTRGLNSMAPIEYCSNIRKWRCKIEEFYFEINQLEPIPADSNQNACIMCQQYKPDGELLCGHRFCMKCSLTMTMCYICKTEPTLPIKIIFD